jgi:hypothetical protein
MDEWIYRATAEEADSTNTSKSLDSGFLCRIAYTVLIEKTGRHQLIANVQHVKVGDVIHVAFSQEREGSRVHSNLGSFEVLKPDHKNADVPVCNSKKRPLPLCRVRVGSPLADLLREAQYKTDPRLKVYTGWFVRRQDPGRSIAFTADMFPGNNALHEYRAGKTP